LEEREDRGARELFGELYEDEAEPQRRRVIVAF
jgi:hypothetical protein